jgi:hypothetical protein
MKNGIFTRKVNVMNTKLTLSLDDGVIDKAKQYAKAHKVSLSKLVERYFDSLENDLPLEVTPAVRELSGIAEAYEDMEKDRMEYLAKKHTS